MDAAEEQERQKWTIGHLYKPAIWGFYVASNYLGVMLCATLMYSVIKNTKRTSTDILIAGLCSGCLWMSLTCGTQCLFSVIYGMFYGGDIACQLEAFFHISAILTQFFCVAAISIRSYFLVVHDYNLSVHAAIWIVLSIWAACVMITFGLSFISPIYLMSAGTYCFFGFSSPAIAMWLLPGLLLSLGVMVFSYVRIWQVTKETQDKVMPLLLKYNEPVQLNSDVPLSGALSTLVPTTASPHSPILPTPIDAVVVINTTLTVQAAPSTPSPSAAATLSATLSTTLSPPTIGARKQLTWRSEVRAPATPRSVTAPHPSVTRADPAAPSNTPVQRPETFVHIRDTASLSIRVAKRSALFIVVLLIGWIFAAVAAIYELSVGRTSEWLVTAVGVVGVSHSWWVPLTYAYTSETHKRTMKRFFGWILIPCYGQLWWQEGALTPSSHGNGGFSSKKSTSPIPQKPTDYLGQVKIESG